MGSVVASGVLLVALLGGHPSLLQRTWRGGFYDVQAHSLLHLKWDVPRGSLGNEAFVLHGKTYMYFGAWPAILRLPIAAVTHTFDGRLTQLSMFLAFALVLISIARLAWQVRTTVAGDRPLDRVELRIVAGFVAMIGLGTPVLFLATEPVVYNEAVMWGLAWALLTLSAVIEFSATRSRSQLLLAAVSATGAFMSRASLGMTAVLAMGLLAVAAVLPRSWRASLGLRDLKLRRGDGVGLGAACVLAITPYAYGNMARFGTLLSVPFSKQLYEIHSRVRTHNHSAEWRQPVQSEVHPDYGPSVHST